MEDRPEFLTGEEHEHEHDSASKRPKVDGHDHEHGHADHTCTDECDHHDHEHGHPDHKCDDKCDHHDHDHDHEHEHGHEHGHPDHKCDDKCDHGHDHGHKHTHTHDDRVSSIGFRVIGELDESKFRPWIGDVLQTHGPDIYRMKGVLAMKGQSHKYVYQGVHMIFTGEPLEPWQDGETRENRLVFIGKDIKKKGLREGFLECFDGTPVVITGGGAATAAPVAEASAAATAVDAVGSS